MYTVDFDHIVKLQHEDKWEELEVEVFKDNKIGRAFYDRYGFKFVHEYIHEETNRAVWRMKYQS